MKIEELLKIVDSGVVEEITISYCGGRIKIEPNRAPFELPNYPIAKIWQNEDGRGLTVLLADNITTDERGAAAESVNTDNKDNPRTEITFSELADSAEKAADTLRKYCARFNVCSKSCVFYSASNDVLPDCRVNYPSDYIRKDGKT